MSKQNIAYVSNENSLRIVKIIASQLKPDSWCSNFDSPTHIVILLQTTISNRKRRVIGKVIIKRGNDDLALYEKAIDILNFNSKD